MKCPDLGFWYHSLVNKTGLFGELADSRVGEGVDNTDQEPPLARKSESAQTTEGWGLSRGQM